VKPTLIFLLLFVIIIIPFVVSCDREEYQYSQRPEEVAKIYFTDPRYNIDFKDEDTGTKNSILCKLDPNLGPGIKVEIEDANGNQLKLEFENQNASGLFTGRIKYYNKNENRWYSSSSLEKVTTLWRGDLEICEFYFNGPREALYSQNKSVQVDSLSIQALREDNQ